MFFWGRRAGCSKHCWTSSFFKLSTWSAQKTILCSSARGKWQNKHQLMLAFLLIPVLSCSLYYWMSDINKNIKICRLHGWWLLSEMCFIINSCALSKTLPHSGEDEVIFSASVEASLVVWKRLYVVGVNRKCFLCVHQATIIQDPVLMFTVRCLQKCLGQSSAPLCSWTARLGSSGSTDQWWGSSIAGVPAFTAMLRNIEPFHYY